MKRLFFLGFISLTLGGKALSAHNIPAPSSDVSVEIVSVKQDSSVQFKIKNNTKKRVYVLGSVHNSLSHKGKVLKIEKGKARVLITYDYNGELTCPHEHNLGFIEIAPQQEIEGTWTGRSFSTDNKSAVSQLEYGEYQIQLEFLSHGVPAGKQLDGLAVSKAFFLKK